MNAPKARQIQIEYRNSQDAWSSYMSALRELIRDSGAKRVLELGGGANPALLLEEVREYNLNYSILDIAQTELDKAPAGYHKVQGDIGSPLSGTHAEYDFIFSKMLAEHLRNGKVFHENVFRLLRPGGIAFHFFPTLYAPPFVANLLLPERLASWILQLVSPRDNYQNAKFPAYYSWCRGPTAKQLQRLQRLGYEIERYNGYYGHEPYYARIPVIRTLHRLFTQFLLRHPSPHLTSFAYVVIRKPVS
ncbi:MAG: class I SAM-dependent methyltransferase [Stenotrophobium sp.]